MPHGTDTSPDYHGYDEGQRLPRLVRLYIWQSLIGFGLSGIFTALLLYFDVVGLRALVMTTQGGFMALFLLFFFNGLVFASVQFAITIMRMADDDGTGGGRRDNMISQIPGRIMAALSRPRPIAQPIHAEDRRQRAE